MHSKKLPPLTPLLQANGAFFVTHTINGRLRGCIGTLKSYRPLAEDAHEHTIAAALHDTRFAPVRVDELEEIEIEISRLTAPMPLEYKNADDLLSKLRSGVDGVVLADGRRRANYLPQV